MTLSGGDLQTIACIAAIVLILAWPAAEWLGRIRSRD